MAKLALSNLTQLIDAIGAGNPNPKARGPVVVEIESQELLGGGRFVRGSYYEGEKTPDVTSRADVILDDGALKPFVLNLIKKGESFITETGSHDMVCTLEWTITPLYVIVQIGFRQSVMGVYGPYPALDDPGLKKDLLEKGFIFPHDKVEARWYHKPGGISAVVCALNPLTDKMV